MNSTLRKVLTPFVALMIVTAGYGVSVQPAAAEWSSECDFTDPLLGAAYNTIIGADSGCRWLSGDQTDVENLTATDGYANGLALKDSADSYVSTTNNFVQNTRTVAMSKGKITLVYELNNENTSTVAKNSVNETVRDYYSRMQYQVIQDWNAKLTQIEYLNNSGADIRLIRPDGSGSSTMAETEGQFNFGYTVPYQLANGTVVDVKATDRGGSSSRVSPVANGSEMFSVGKFQVKDPDTGTWTTMVDSTQYGYVTQGGTTWDLSTADGGSWDGTDLLGQMQNQDQYVTDNLAPYVDEVYAQYNAGEINLTDMAQIDPSVIGNEASTEFNSTGYYGHAAIMLASIGAAGNINHSHTIETGDGTSLNGTLYYTADDYPTAGWQTGTQYNITDYNGTFYMAVQKDSGNGTIVNLADYGENFTIVNATNTKTGEAVNATKVQAYTYDSTNASALAEEIDRLEALRETYEEQSTSGGGGGWGLGGASTGAAVALFAVLALLLVGGKD